MFFAYEGTPCIAQVKQKIINPPTFDPWPTTKLFPMILPAPALCQTVNSHIYMPHMSGFINGYVVQQICYMLNSRLACCLFI
jgi:hypothetical protein